MLSFFLQNQGKIVKKQEKEAVFSKKGVYKSGVL